VRSQRAIVVAIAVLVVGIVSAEAFAATGRVLPIQPVEGAEFSGTVASFEQVNHLGPDPPTATIYWGDGTAVEAATVAVGASPDEYLVSGRHAYQDAGRFSLTVTLSWENDGPLQTLANGEVTVADAPLTPEPITFNPTAGVPFNGVVGFFSDANPSSSLGDFAGAVIDWGDGTESPGTIELSRRGYQVSGTHTYQRAGNFAADVIVLSKAGASTTIRSTARVVGVPRATFTVFPRSPCANDVVVFDASASTTSPGARIVKHSWEFSSRDNRGLPANAETGATPRHKARFGYSYLEMRLAHEEDGELVFPELPVVRYHRPVVIAKLVVTDSTGGVAVARRKLKFRDDRFRPTEANPEPDCGRGGQLLSDARFLTDAAVLAAAVGDSGAFRLRLGCRKVADCLVFAGVRLLGSGRSLGTLHRGDVIAAGSALVSAGTRRGIRMRTSRAARRLLARRSRLRGRVFVRITNAQGRSHRESRPIVLRKR
jgi:hypothetical protein